jgi:hypothetical protein
MMTLATVALVLGSLGLKLMVIDAICGVED